MESRDNKLVIGAYRVALPDGRIQIVNYRVDSSGYVADVQYEGYATYPDHKKAPAWKLH